MRTSYIILASPCNSPNRSGTRKETTNQYNKRAVPTTKTMSSSSSKSKAHLRLRSDSNRMTFTNMLASVEAAAAESLSEDALVHLKSYKYSSVDESYISNYILKHYVRRTTKRSLWRHRLANTKEYSGMHVWNSFPCGWRRTW